MIAGSSTHGTQAVFHCKATRLLAYTLVVYRRRSFKTCKRGSVVLHSNEGFSCSLHPVVCMCRESRYFKTWKRLRFVEEHMLMTAIADITDQRSVPFGDGALIFK